MYIRKTKIVCTLGPASYDRKIIRSLIKSGMDVARLNFSHGSHDDHYAVAQNVRQEAFKLGKNTAILQDLQGIKIRVAMVEKGAITLKTGSTIKLKPGSEESNNDTIYISYPALLTDVNEGDLILLDDGLLRLNVKEKKDDHMVAEILEGGILKSKKGVNFPYSKTTLPAFTEKDKQDLLFGIELGVDYVAVSFVRSAEDIEVIKKWAKKKNLVLPPLIAKIEKPEALDNIQEILDIVDGIMVARGDLGVELPTERVPVIQKMLIEEANKKGKLVITATQMLESMKEHSRPTRAEATDVANAVLDGTDALMLSAETAAGKFPVQSVVMMDTIIKHTEMMLFNRIPCFYQIGKIFPEAIADGAKESALVTNAKVIVVFTHSGFTAKLLSKLKPEVPIVSFTPDQKVVRSMSLFWGTTAMALETPDVTILDEVFMRTVEKKLIKEGFIQKGDNVVFAASSPFLGKANIVRLHKVI
ncbi:MAG: pyruvate kinase [Thermodesulfovibrionales bacterium]|nr:pyruvate kinase [Thermodesulfovibrionales bacterium]